MYLLSKKDPSENVKEFGVTIVFLRSIIITVIFSLEGSYADGICSILLLCMESNALEKSTNISIAWFLRPSPSMIRQIESVMLWVDFSESCSDFS